MSGPNDIDWMLSLTKKATTSTGKNSNSSSNSNSNSNDGDNGNGSGRVEPPYKRRKENK